MPTSTVHRQVTAPISFVSATPDHEKAYQIVYEDGEDLPRTNIMREFVSIDLEDVRGREKQLSFSETGCAIRELNSNMSYDDFNDDGKIRDVYFKELEKHVQDFLGARRVKFFRYGIRKRHAEFPVSTGKPYEFDQPTMLAHVDATEDAAQEEMLKQFGDTASQLMDGRYQWINVWKPLRGPVNDWPLCLCDASTIDEEDAIVTDMVYADYYAENISLRFNEGQKWFFLSNHQPYEIIIFKQSDSDRSAVRGVPHCSFANPDASAGELPRESIEARALVVY